MERKYAKSNGDKKRIRPNTERVRLRNTKKDSDVNFRENKKSKNNKKQSK